MKIIRDGGRNLAGFPSDCVVHLDPAISIRLREQARARVETRTHRNSSLSAPKSEPGLRADAMTTLYYTLSTSRLTCFYRPLVSSVCLPLGLGAGCTIRAKVTGSRRW